MRKKVIGVFVILLVAILYKISGITGSEKVNGVVTDIITHGSGRNSDVFPNVMFNYKGTLYEIPHKEGSIFISHYNIGDSVTVYFPEEQPRAAALYGFMEYYFTFPTIAIVGVLCIFWIGISNIIDLPGLSSGNDE